MNESMVCCPLSGSDEYAEVSDIDVRTARKEHDCCECGDPIAPGVKYEHASLLFDGRWTTYKTCLLCVEIRTHFACGNGWLYEQLWNDLLENFFRDMKAGGKCMEGLSPAAKQRLVDKRMEWYLAQDEIDDSIWDGWRPQ